MWHYLESSETACSETLPESFLNMEGDFSIGVPQTKRVIQPPEKSDGWKAKEGGNGFAAKKDPDKRHWEIYQCSSEKDLSGAEWTWPKWGVMYKNSAWELISPYRDLEVEDYFNGGKMWLTPTVMQIAPTEHRREKRKAFRASVGRQDVPGGLTEQVLTPAFWPTPTCQETSHPNAKLTETGRRLTKDGKNSHSLNLVDTILRKEKKWPTPKALEVNESVEQWEKRRKRPSAKMMGPSLTVAVKMDSQGLLNPDWVEWLMGWPIGWTSMEPLSKEKFQEWLKGFDII